MIIVNIDSVTIPNQKAKLRIREESEGGFAFDPVSGSVSLLNEEELARSREKAANHPGIIYYATRSWSDKPLTDGCTSSPNRIYLEVTQQCNLSCSFCFRSAGSAAPNEFCKEDMLNLILKLSTMGIHEIRFTGGEPTMRPDFIELVDQALSAGIYVSLGTNGNFSDTILAQLLSRPIGRYLVSLEGIKPVHDELRGKGTFDRTIRTIDRLLRAGKNVRINTMLTRSTLKHLPALANLCMSHQITRMALIPPRPSGRAAEESFSRETPGISEMETAARMIGSLAQKYGVEIEFHYDLYRHSSPGQGSDPVIQKISSCPAGREAGFISPEGWFYACGCSPGWSPDPSVRKPFSAGNMRSLSSSEIWHLWQCSSVWEPFRDLHASKDSACFLCKHYKSNCFGSCPVHAFLNTGAFNAADPMCWFRDDAIKGS